MAITHRDRTIIDFRSRMQGGGARSNLFEVNITYPDNIGVQEGDDGATSKGEFLIKAAELPASNIGNIPVPFRGRVLPIAGDRTFDPWTVTVINDTDFVIRDAMERWSNSINDIQTAQGTIDPTAYQKTATVKQFSRQGTTETSNIQTLRQYNFVGIYPNVVSSIPLDYGATDQIEEFQVTFNYLFYEIIPTPPLAAFGTTGEGPTGN
tara:strand:- start:42 stop:665 length:624 start_codon:yes stop_codon:yes gene_type:complete